MVLVRSVALKEAAEAILRFAPKPHGQARVFVSASNHGLNDAQGAVVAAIKHAGCKFCVEALNEAIAKYGRPQIMNRDQGSQIRESVCRQGFWDQWRPKLRESLAHLVG